MSPVDPLVRLRQIGQMLVCDGEAFLPNADGAKAFATLLNIQSQSARIAQLEGEIGILNARIRVLLDSVERSDQIRTMLFEILDRLYTSLNHQPPPSYLWADELDKYSDDPGGVKTSILGHFEPLIGK